MRVMLVSGPAAGGIRRHLEALASGLPARGFEVAVAAPEQTRIGTPVDRFRLDIGTRPNPLHDMRTVLALGRLVRESKVDLVHAHGVKAALLALLALGPGSPPVAATFHNLWSGGLLDPLLRTLLPRAAAVVFVSEAVRSSVLSPTGKPAVRPRLRRAQVISNGVDTARFTPPAVRCPAPPFIVSFVGRLSSEKGVEVLLAAARRLAGRTDLRLLMAGDGSLRPPVEEAVRDPAIPLQYLGFQEDVLPVYHGSQAVLVPSLSEGQGLSALEAMACGLPVIASRVGGLPEVVVEGETGVLIPPGDADALAKTLDAMAAEPDRAWQMGQAGRKRVEARFSLDRMLDRLAALYLDVVQGAR